jgi:hypothetical protein
LASCAETKQAKNEEPLPKIMAGELNQQEDPVKTERLVERVGAQPYSIAEPAFVASLAFVNTLPPIQQNSASAYIRASQSLHYLNLLLDSGRSLRPTTPWTLLQTLEKNNWASVRQQAVHLLTRITGYVPIDPPPDRFAEANAAGGPRPGSLKNLNEPVRTIPYGLITPVRQTGCEDQYYTELAAEYRQLLVTKSKLQQRYFRRHPQPPVSNCLPSSYNGP